MAKREIDNPPIAPYIRELQTAHRQLRNGPITVRMTGTLRGLYDGVITGRFRRLQTAIRAGYGKRGAHVRGAELVTNRKVAAAIGGV